MLVCDATERQLHPHSFQYTSCINLARAEAVMALHLVCMELEIPHEVLVAPQASKIADINSGERGKALVAGLIPALCGYEDMGLAIKTYAVPMMSYSEDIKLMLCLTDGACNDAELGKKVCHALRGKVEVIGILLDPDEQTRGHVTEMFGEDRVIASCSDELPGRLGNILGNSGHLMVLLNLKGLSLRKFFPILQQKFTRFSRSGSS